MTPEILELWQRAHRSLRSATKVANADPDTSASCAHYAAFHAVSAYFVAQGQTYAKHSGLRSAVHRELVHSGKWNTELGADFDWLSNQRRIGTYGGSSHVTDADAARAVPTAQRILQAVHTLLPDLPIINP